MRRFALSLAIFLASPALGHAVDVDTPMRYEKKFSGDQNLRFSRGGQRLNPKGARLQYRVVRNQKDWKRIWGYLYDNSLDVDFRTHRVLAIYKSPANGGFSISPTRVARIGKRLKVEVEVTWNGKTSRSHPFLFLVVDKFWGLDVEEKFIAPPGKKKRFP